MVEIYFHTSVFLELVQIQKTEKEEIVYKQGVSAKGCLVLQQVNGLAFHLCK